jgi:hypothetical protein
MDTTGTTIEFTRVNNDVNGNPRYVCHFLNLINDKDEQEIKADFAATLAREPWKLTSLKYEHALYKAKKIGGRKFHNKQYGGGIVFQSYNIKDTEQSILNLLK